MSFSSQSLGPGQSQQKEGEMEETTPIPLPPPLLHQTSYSDSNPTLDEYANCLYRVQVTHLNEIASCLSTKKKDEDGQRLISSIKAFLKEYEKLIELEINKGGCEYIERLKQRQNQYTLRKYVDTIYHGYKNAIEKDPDRFEQILLSQLK